MEHGQFVSVTVWLHVCELCVHKNWNLWSDFDEIFRADRLSDGD